jgi:Tfp pilus assembly pilus retraction ATPase PilT
MCIRDLIFSDLFVADEAANSWFKSTPDSLDVHLVPEPCFEELNDLRRELVSHSGSSDFRIDWGTEDTLRLRVGRIKVADSKIIFVCRRFRVAPDSLGSLGMPPSVTDKLLSPDLREGLVVFFGKSGAGKTTTAGSFIKERLKKFGGVCWTVENPIELPLQGMHGKGWCYQTEVETDDGIGPAVRQMLRAIPNMILVGEMRDGLSVRESISAATSGHLVVATFHAPDLISGLSRLARLAGNNSSASVADAMRVGIHLALHNHDPIKKIQTEALSISGTLGTGIPARILTVEPLWMTGETEVGLKSMMRDGEYHLLKSEIERQRRTFLMSRLP